MCFLCVRSFHVIEKISGGAWEDRFTYDYVLEKYNSAMSIGKVDNFYQELMLQIMSDDDRLIHDSDIQWYSLPNLLDKRGNFNFYITTDFATSEKESADFSFISVWAVNHKGYYFWVDGETVNVKQWIRT